MTDSKTEKKWTKTNMTKAENRTFRVLTKQRAFAGFGDGLVAQALLELTDAIRESQADPK